MCLRSACLFMSFYAFLCLFPVNPHVHISILLIHIGALLAYCIVYSFLNICLFLFRSFRFVTFRLFRCRLFSFYSILFWSNAWIRFAFFIRCSSIYSTICENKINSLIANARYDETKRIMATLMLCVCIMTMWWLYLLRAFLPTFRFVSLFFGVR